MMQRLVFSLPWVARACGWSKDAYVVIWFKTTFSVNKNPKGNRSRHGRADVHHRGIFVEVADQGAVRLMGSCATDARG